MTRICGWCGQPTDDFIVHDIEADHGPDAVVWCRDWRACHPARTGGSVVSRALRAQAPAS
ncbi:hypothetical protein [Streptomyces sp. NPDC020983]|uniref:hypothetical protein n=1 Tax=Streptomyces sp. NPDC020983 TaxID=3365106 RepID=UPI0037AE953D